jgi:hypothetical protein
MKLTTILLLSSSVLLVSCAAEKAEKVAKAEKAEVETRPYLVLCFDVEDYTSPESVGMDDIPRWLAETLTDVGPPGASSSSGRRPALWRPEDGGTWSRPWPATTWEATPASGPSTPR